MTEVAYLFANGVRLARLAYEPPGDVPAINGENLHVFFELGDHLGSTSVVLDKATGELVERSTYQAYGGTESDYRPERWKSFREDYRFTGKEEDVEAGLIYFGRRFLNPLLNRWVSADPLTVHGLGADPNLYAYVSAWVLKSVDPLGLCDDDGSGGCGSGPSTQDGTPTEGASGTGNTEDLGIDRGLLGRAVGGTVIAVVDFAGVVAMGLFAGFVIPGDSGQPGQAYPEEQVAIVMLVTGLGSAVKPLSRPLISEGTPTARPTPRPLTKAEANKAVARNLDKVAAQVDRTVEVLNQGKIAAATDGSAATGVVKAPCSGRQCSGAAGAEPATGKVYVVSENNTLSGKRYVGRTRQRSPAKRGKRDGRDRKDAKVSDYYNPDVPKAGARAEQYRMNKEGGVDNLDNKRNEIPEHEWSNNGIDPP